MTISLVFVLLIVAALHVILGIYAFRFRNVPAAVPFGIAMFLAAVWAGALAMELASSGLAGKIFWSDIRIPATGMLAVTWLVMSIRHARLPWLNRGRIGALFIVPAITTLILWTGVYSALYRYNFRLDTTGIFPTLIADTGPWYWIAGVLYGEVMIFASVILLIRSLRGAAALYRKQTAMIIVAGLVPVVVELFSQAVPRLRGGSFTPVVFAFTGTLVALSLFRYHALDIVTLARSLVLESMRGLVLVLDGEGRVVDLNPAAQRTLGLTSLDMIGHKAEQVLSDWIGLPVGLGTMEFAVGEMDQRRVYDMDVSPIKNNVGDAMGSVLLLHDVTELKRMEADLRHYTERLERLTEQRTRALRESEEKYRQMYETSLNGIYVTATDGRILDLNPAGVAMFGYSSLEEIKNVNAADLYVDPRDRERILELARSGVIKGIETKLRRKDGQVVNVIMNVYSILDHEGNLTQLRGSIFDNTEIKRIEEDLRSARERLDYLIESNPAVIYSGKPLPDLSDFVLTYVSDRVVGMFGYAPEDFVGHPEFWERHVPTEDQNEIYAQMVRLWKEGHLTIEYRFLHRDGFYRWVREEANLVRGADGSPVEVSGYWTDISEEKQMEARLAEAQRLVAIGEATSMIGHDLRNPLQAIFSTIYIAKKKLGEMSESRSDPGEVSGLMGMMETIERESDYMDKIVSDLQDYSQPVRVELRPVEMESIIKEVLSKVQVPNNIGVSVSFDQPTHTHMMDPVMIRRIFTNLIMNAIQAMPNGGALRINGYGGDRGSHIIEVRDTGVGIPEQDLGRLFNPFFTTKAKGQGLGLAVCERLIETQGGSITVESKLGVGTKFTVKLPPQRT